MLVQLYIQGWSIAYLLLIQVIGEVSDHDLSLGWNSILWWSTLLAWFTSLGLGAISFGGWCGSFSSDSLFAFSLYFTGIGVLAAL